MQRHLRSCVRAIGLVAAIQCSLAPALFAAPDPDPKARYTVVKDDSGVWWFQAPDGRKFYSLGISNVSPEPYMPRPGTTFYNPVPGDFKGDLKAWTTSVRNLLHDNGFNTLGRLSSSCSRCPHHAR